MSGVVPQKLCQSEFFLFHVLDHNVYPTNFVPFLPKFLLNITEVVTSGL